MEGQADVFRRDGSVEIDETKEISKKKVMKYIVHHTLWVWILLYPHHRGLPFKNLKRDIYDQIFVWKID